MNKNNTKSIRCGFGKVLKTALRMFFDILKKKNSDFSKNNSLYLQSANYEGLRL
jgi:hypothetical protein